MTILDWVYWRQMSLVSGVVWVSIVRGASFDLRLLKPYKTWIRLQYTAHDPPAKEQFYMDLNRDNQVNLQHQECVVVQHRSAYSLGTGVAGRLLND